MTRQQAMDAALASFRVELDGVERMAALATAEATDSESKAEGKYDTRATEASYLARGQAERVTSLRRLVSWFQQENVPPTDRVGVGSLVQVEDNGARAWWLVLPDGGGRRIQVGDISVVIVTPAAPVGRALLGAQVDDAVEVWIGERERFVEVLALPG